MATKAQQQPTTRPAPSQAPGRVLQRSAVSADLAGVEAPSIVQDVLRSPGQPLDDDTRSFMEPRFDHDFSHVRVHTDSRAAESARAINARAYTVGNHIAFGNGEFRPGSSDGDQLLTHELTHTLQLPKQGLEGNPDRPLAVAQADDPLEIEARANSSTRQGHRINALRRSRGSAPSRSVVYRQPSGQTPPTGGATPAPPRIVYIDANVLEQINRGNQNAANTLRQMIASGVEVRVAAWTYREMVVQPAIPRTGVAKREMIRDLGLRVGQDVPLQERVDVRSANQTRTGAPIVSERDAQLVAAARSGRGEIWSFDRGFRNNARGVERTFGVRIAPETTSVPIVTGVEDFRVGRRLMGLAPITISVSGQVTRGTLPPPTTGGGGGAAPPGTPPSSGSRSPAPTTTTSPGSAQGTTARTGTPDMRPVQVGGPSARGTAIAGGALLGLQAIGSILNFFNDRVQQDRVRAALAAIEPTLTSSLQSQPHMGVLIVFFYSQSRGHPDSAIQPGPVFGHIETARGRTRDEAEQAFASTPSLRQGFGPNTLQFTREVWIPPRTAPGISAIRTPFPAIAVGTFADGRARLQDVEWGGLNGFDDEGETSLSITPTLTPRFLILRVPEQFNWYYGGLHTSRIPVVNKNAAQGGSIPTINLDPINPFGDVHAACIFPADDATARLFSSAPATRDNLRHIRYTNFGRARWVRPGNVRVLERR